MPRTDTSGNILGDTIKQLLKLRGMKAYELGETIGLSPTSISKIMNGVSRPRQNTFTRMCQALCKTKDEERKLVSAFAGTELLEEEPDQVLPSAEKEILRLRAEQFMERKTQSIQFKRSVARELDRAGITYSQDYCQGIYSTDFLLEENGQRVGLECKANPNRDWNKTKMTMVIISNKMQLDHCFVIVPYLQGLNDEVSAEDVLTPALICERLKLSHNK